MNSAHKRLLKIALYLPGQTRPEIRVRYGDFEDWFAANLVRQRVTTRTFEVRKGQFPDLKSIDAIIVTGSASSVCTEPDPWVSSLQNHLQTVLQEDIPALGVCFGHQVLAAAAGATVSPHPTGREMGTTELHLTDEGKTHQLFRGISADFQAQETHEDVVTQLPETSEISVLAENDHNPYQALAYSRKIFSVQFHPEISASIMRAYLSGYGKSLVQKNEMDQAKLDERFQNVKETNTGEVLLKNFIEIVREA